MASYLAFKVNESVMLIMYLLWWLCMYSRGPKINRDLNSTMMHFSSKFGNPTWTRGDFAQAQNGVNFDF